MRTSQKYLKDALTPWTAVVVRPLLYVAVLCLVRPVVRPPVPRATVLPCPLQNIKLASSRSKSTHTGIPNAACFSRPLTQRNGAYDCANRRAVQYDRQRCPFWQHCTRSILQPSLLNEFKLFANQRCRKRMTLSDVTQHVLKKFI